jgi:MGT family glycosyltransferase
VQEPVVLQAAAKAFANKPYEVVMATGTHRDPVELGLGSLAPNIRVERWIPYDHLLPKTSVVVTTGGAGTVLSALMAGVPVVVIPTEWDKPDNAQRVVEAGVGLRLSPRRLTPKKLLHAVESVLRTDAFRKNARRLAETFHQSGGPKAGATLLETLIESPAAPTTC